MVKRSWVLTKGTFFILIIELFVMSHASYIRHNLRLTFNSPSTLMVHLPHATMAIVSIQQLTQLLMDETKRTLHARICEIGVDICGTLKGTWFVDEIMNRAVGRWEGCAL